MIDRLNRSAKSRLTIQFFEEHGSAVAADSAMVHDGYPVSQDVCLLHEVSRNYRRSLTSETLRVDKIRLEISYETIRYFGKKHNPILKKKNLTQPWAFPTN